MESTSNKKRRVILMLVTTFVISNISFGQMAENSFYYAFGEKIILIPQIDKYQIKYSRQITDKVNFIETIKQKLPNVKCSWINNSIIELDLAQVENKEEILETFNKQEDLASIYPLFKTSDNLNVGLTNEVLVSFNTNVNSVKKDSVLNQYNLQLIKRTKIYELYSIPKSNDVLTVADKLYETGLFNFSYPNIICKAEKFGTYPNDPYFQYQITLNNTGQVFNDGHTGTYDADIDAPEAWDITTGSGNISIAVFDEGVTSDHPDLPNSRQIRLDGSNFGAGNPNDPSPTGNSNHGNACSGVIAATMNNNEGVAGVAPNCKIMPLRWDENTMSSGMADGIEFAADNGADIISNSWGYNSSNNNLFPVIVSAIQYAVTQGRDGKGCVVAFAAGNTADHSVGYNGYVAFPANVNISGVLTVGASERYDHQANYSPTSQLIDIVAPSHKSYPCQISGETFEMWSIDIPGTSGYNPWQINEYCMNPPQVGETLPSSGTNYLSYTGRFGGTSHACPVVAGIAALVLSLNSTLTQQQVFDILTGYADKVGGYTYTNNRCNEMGYGRVNTYAAVLSPLACTTTNFINQTVTTNTTVNGCNVYIQNVTVQNNSKLTVGAQNEILIDGSFEVQLGSEIDFH